MEASAVSVDLSRLEVWHPIAPPTQGACDSMMTNQEMSLVKCLSDKRLVKIYPNTKLQGTHRLFLITSTRYRYPEICVSKKVACSKMCALVPLANPSSLSCPNPDILSFLN